MKALLLLQKTLKGKHHSLRPEIDLIALALTGTTKVDFSKVIKMIDEMVVLLGKEQADDDHKKEYCEKQLDFTEDKTKELGHAIADLDTQMMIIRRSTAKNSWISRRIRQKNWATPLLISTHRLQISEKPSRRLRRRSKPSMMGSRHLTRL